MLFGLKTSIINRSAILKQNGGLSETPRYFTTDFEIARIIFVTWTLIYLF